MTDATTTAVLEPVLAAVRATGWTVRVLDLHGVTGKPAFLDRCAGALDLPDWFGRNWDALADSLKDLSWLPPSRGRLLLVTAWQAYAAAQPGEWAVAQEVFDDVQAHWEKRAEGFAVLLTAGTG
jgi:hypothetical protein